MKKMAFHVLAVFLLMAVSLHLAQCAKKKPGTGPDKPASSSAPAKSEGSKPTKETAEHSATQPQPGSGASAPAKPGPDLVKVIILLEKGDKSGLDAVTKKVEGMGGKVTTTMLPAGLYGLIPAGKESELKGYKEIKSVSSGAVDPAKIKGLSDLQKALLKDWNDMATNTRPPTLVPNPPPPPNDARTRPETAEPDNNDIHPPKEIPDEKK
jgi:hypothetical protein